MPANLMEIIRAKIQQSGPISLEEYMGLALMHPEYGYYMTKDPFGAGGDFTTAPEMTQAFGELIGLWCVDIWQSIGRPENFSLVEIGPGRGTLMHDALRAARVKPEFLKGAKVHLVEPSLHLRKRQSELLGAYNPTWIDKVGQLPDLPTITIANEVFDALPIKQFVRLRQGWMERRVGLSPTGSLVFVLQTAPDCPSFDMPEESVVEVCPSAGEFASAIARPIVKNRGAALIIDYGDDEVYGETLQAISHHRAAHPLTAPGVADITAHVNFEPLATAMRKIGCRIHGTKNMGDWLMEVGIRERTEQLVMRADETQSRSLIAALQRLTDQSSASAMGKLFKVIAITDRATPTPSGFHL